MSINLGFSSLLGLLFIGLKLCHQIDWSWPVVLLPFYWLSVVCLFAYAFGILVCVVAGIVDFFK